MIGILAHVDAGKTTLSESMLYLSGKIRKLGRVDKKDAYLDTYELEKERGITIFSKQAIFEVEERQITLLDTPGHVDFSAEMERALRVLDYGILVISGADGVQGHTKTLWRLLELYQVPIFLFINKMDQNGIDKDQILKEMRKQLDDRCIEFGQDETAEFYDQLAMCDEKMMEAYLEEENIELSKIKRAIKERVVFPCFFGSALKLEGIEEFMKGIVKYASIPSYPKEFGAKVFKIARDQQGNRLTFMKLTGGSLKVKDVINNGVWQEKVNQIRIYSGEKFEAVNEIKAGSVCAVIGLSKTKPGEGLGIEENIEGAILEPVLSYQIILPPDCAPRMMLPKLREIEEEIPELCIVWDDELQEIKAQFMGEVQIEILQSLIESRYGVKVDLDAARILYKETIGNIVEGVGHFEPLRHYAEVHLLLEPGEVGSGLVFEMECSEDILAKSWQRLVLSHLKEKTHKGVLTGSPITDMKITLVSGRAHNEHTDGGDFREATYRGVRQGLKEAESILLEPYYSFQLELPEKLVGRAMTDIEKMHGTYEITKSNGEMVVLVGKAPVITMRNYQKEVVAYTKGEGRFFCSLKGYEPCHNPEEVIERMGYDSERDIANPTSSVFCQNGTGFTVNWDKVKDYMHIESYLKEIDDSLEEIIQNQIPTTEEKWIDLEEIDRIFDKTFYANKGKKSSWKRNRSASESYYKSEPYIGRPQETKEKYLIVDGYNIIFAWPELKDLADVNMESARMKLLDYLSNYQGIEKCQIIVAFDAYRLQGHLQEEIKYRNIHMVYTKEAQTADQYIERFVHEKQKEYSIVVATSDALQQIIIRGAGCSLLSARELKEEIERVNEIINQSFEKMKGTGGYYLEDTLSSETKQQINDMISTEDD